MTWQWVALILGVVWAFVAVMIASVWRAARPLPEVQVTDPRLSRRGG